MASGFMSSVVTRLFPGKGRGKTQNDHKDNAQNLLETSPRSTDLKDQKEHRRKETKKNKSRSRCDLDIEVSPSAAGGSKSAVKTRGEGSHRKSPLFASLRKRTRPLSCFVARPESPTEIREMLDQSSAKSKKNSPKEQGKEKEQGKPNATTAKPRKEKKKKARRPLSCIVQPPSPKFPHLDRSFSELETAGDAKSGSEAKQPRSDWKPRPVSCFVEPPRDRAPPPYCRRPARDSPYHTQHPSLQSDSGIHLDIGSRQSPLLYSDAPQFSQQPFLPQQTPPQSSHSDAIRQPLLYHRESQGERAASPYLSTEEAPPRYPSPHFYVDMSPQTSPQPGRPLQQGSAPSPSPYYYYTDAASGQPSSSHAETTSQQPLSHYNDENPQHQLPSRCVDSHKRPLSCYAEIPRMSTPVPDSPRYSNLPEKNDSGDFDDSRGYSHHPDPHERADSSRGFSTSPASSYCRPVSSAQVGSASGFSHGSQAACYSSPSASISSSGGATTGRSYDLKSYFPSAAPLPSPRRGAGGQQRGGGPRRPQSACFLCEPLPCCVEAGRSCRPVSQCFVPGCTLPCVIPYPRPPPVASTPGQPYHQRSWEAAYGPPSRGSNRSPLVENHLENIDIDLSQTSVQPLRMERPQEDPLHEARDPQLTLTPEARHAPSPAQPRSFDLPSSEPQTQETESSEPNEQSNLPQQLTQPEYEASGPLHQTQKQQPIIQAERVQFLGTDEESRDSPAELSSSPPVPRPRSLALQFRNHPGPHPPSSQISSSSPGVSKRPTSRMPRPKSACLLSSSEVEGAPLALAVPESSPAPSPPPRRAANLRKFRSADCLDRVDELEQLDFVPPPARPLHYFADSDNNSNEQRRLEGGEEQEEEDDRGASRQKESERDLIYTSAEMLEKVGQPDSRSRPRSRDKEPGCRPVSCFVGSADESGYLSSQTLVGSGLGWLGGLSASTGDILEVMDPEELNVADDELSFERASSFRKAWSVCSLLRQDSIQDRSFTVMRKRRQRMKDRRGQTNNCRSSSTETDEGVDLKGSHSASSLLDDGMNKRADSLSGLDCLPLLGESGGVGSRGGRMLHVPKQSRGRVARLHSVHMKAWEIRLRRKQMMMKRRSWERLNGGPRKETLV